MNINFNILIQNFSDGNLMINSNDTIEIINSKKEHRKSQPILACNLILEVLEDLERKNKKIDIILLNEYRKEHVNQVDLKFKNKYAIKQHIPSTDTGFAMIISKEFLNEMGIKEEDITCPKVSNSHIFAIWEMKSPNYSKPFSLISTRILDLSKKGKSDIVKAKERQELAIELANETDGNIILGGGDMNTFANEKLENGKWIDILSQDLNGYAQQFYNNKILQEILDLNKTVLSTPIGFSFKVNKYRRGAFDHFISSPNIKVEEIEYIETIKENIFDHKMIYCSCSYSKE